ncbi:zinc finger protein 395-like isoform X1 [Hemiscyllium ocellatum]|uniref:zinc finger protein 395-like isoform X1 n=1 Tax=Hemiscyllium ocellatum TaxID=170820 RepID=UPI002966EF02|nr:zinc finger protein 395-like isoform X1 [Hemiscyllium ocellatum]XP_060687177.1 zinc finger protein 395-like isoform X1 [Hemiscyllium ocellatum]XP_060687178.1 zinc finger protein 395-like isoform X1 [Hemiscyllium ocellatum]
MASVLSRRLGKRSLLGATVHTLSPSGSGILIPGVIQAYRLDSGKGNSSYTVSFEDGQFKEYSEDSIIGPGFQSLSRFKLYPGQRVYLTHSGREYVGLVEQHNHLDNEVLVYVKELDLRSLRKIEDVRLAESRKSPRLQEQERENLRATSKQAESKRIHCSESIDIPPRGPGMVDMDEVMAAMVLTSLSSSPLVNSPLNSSTMPGLAESGSETTSGSSGKWSWGSDTPSPSTPPFGQSAGLAQGGDGSERHGTQPLLLEEPTARKRKNSMKLLYRCMWPLCQKLLSSPAGIRRHIRTVHLGRGDCEHSDGEEDFYYTEISVSEDENPDTVSTRRCVSPPAVLQDQRVSVTPSQGGSSEHQLPGPLSQSAPSSLWQVCVDHTYQISPDYRCAFTFGDCSIQPQVTLLKPHVVFASPVPSLSGTRKIRGEAKKCRKVYGLENRSQWCTACRWKKACQRFHD